MNTLARWSHRINTAIDKNQVWSYSLFWAVLVAISVVWLAYDVYSVSPTAEADEVVPNIRYIQDPRTGICFAYYWGGGGAGGPALAVVPRESIPDELLTIAQQP